MRIKWAAIAAAIMLTSSAQTVFAGDTVYVNAVSIIPDKKCKYPLKLSVKTAKKPERVIELCEGKEISFCYENGRVNFSDEIAFEAAYKIQ